MQIFTKNVVLDLSLESPQDVVVGCVFFFFGVFFFFLWCGVF